MKNHRKFKPFRRVQGEHGGNFGCGLKCILVRDKRYLLQKAFQTFVLRLKSDATQLHHIFPAVGAFFTAIINIGAIVYILQDLIH